MISALLDVKKLANYIDGQWVEGKELYRSV